MVKRAQLILIFIVFGMVLRAGSPADSLRLKLRTAKEDTAKVKLLNALAWAQKESDPDSTYLLSKQAMALSVKLKWAAGAGDAHNNLGAYFFLKGDYYESLAQHDSAFSIRSQQKDRKGMAVSLGNIGLAHRLLGNFPLAMEFHLRALKLAEETGDLKLQANNLGNIGVIYRNQANYNEALQYYQRALKKTEELGDSAAMIRHIANMGLVLYNKGEYDRALEYHHKALQMEERAGNKNSVSRHLVNIGAALQEQKKYDEALDYYFKALRLREELGAEDLVATNLGNIGALYNLKKNYSEALVYCHKSLVLSQKTGDKGMCGENHENLSKIYSATGDHKKALFHFQLFIRYRDSLQNEAATKKTVQLQMQYDFDKKTQAEKIKFEENKKAEAIRHDAEIARQQTFTYLGIAGFLVMVIVATVSGLAFRNKKKANIEIARQKMLVEHKQKEILDSIRYAQRIQQSLLTREDYIRKNIKRLSKHE